MASPSAIAGEGGLNRFPAPVVKASTAFIQNYQESALVFTLGHIEELSVTYTLDGGGGPVSGVLTRTKRARIEQHAAVNGYHVRTIPHQRFTSPAIVAAGAGRLVVVDRGASLDTIRVTNKYAGLTEETFVDYLENPSYDWAALADDAQIVVPSGYRVTGLQMSDRDILIACLAPVASWGTETASFALTYDFRLYPPYGDVLSPTVDDLIELPSGFYNGPTVARPCLLNNATAEDIILVALCCSPPEGAASFALLDIVRKRVRFAKCLPDGWFPFAASGCHDVLNVACRSGRQASVNVNPVGGSSAYQESATAVFRFFMADPYASFVAPPWWTDYHDDAEVTSTWHALDSQPVKPMRFGDEPFSAPNSETIDSLAQYADAVSEPRVLSPELLSVKGLNRTQAPVLLDLTEENVSSGSPQARRIGFFKVDSPGTEGLHLIDCDATNNTFIECWRQMSGVDILRDKPIFRGAHASHYAWLSEGGFTYKTYEPSS